jgi:hypothetical protein
MSKSFLVSIDLNKNELLNARLQNLASAPSSPVVGQFYYDTVANAVYFWNGSAWTNIATNSALLGGQNSAYHLSRANHTGTQLASTISDFDTQVRTSRLDQMAAPTANVSLNSNKITNLADGTNPQDAATVAQVQAAAAGIDAKASCRYTTTGNITLSGTGTQANGDWPSSLTAGDRILVKNQSTGAENGIYTAAAGSWTRSTDCDSTSEYTSQAFTFIEEGSTLAGTQWKVSTTGSITVGTTSVTWAQFGAGSTYTNGNGIDLSGNTFSAKLKTSGGLLFDSTEIAIDTAIVVRKYSANVGDGTSTSIVINHALNTRDVTVGIYRNGSPYDEPECDIEHTDANNVTLKFNVAPTSNQYRAVVHA